MDMDVQLYNCVGCGATLTYGRPGGRLPNIIQLPVEGTHGVPFTSNDVALTATVEFRLSFYTLGLHDLHRQNMVFAYLILCSPHITFVKQSIFLALRLKCDMFAFYCHLRDIYSVSVSLPEVCFVGNDVMQWCLLKHLQISRLMVLSMLWELTVEILVCGNWHLLTHTLTEYLHLQEHNVLYQHLYLKALPYWGWKVRARTESRTQRRSACGEKSSSPNSQWGSCRSGHLHNEYHRGSGPPSLLSQTPHHWLG